MDRFHRLISFVFHPLLVPTIGMGVFLFSMNLQNNAYVSSVMVATFLFTAVFPLLPIRLFMRMRNIQDINLTEKKDRRLPYIISLLAYLLWVVFLWRSAKMPTFVVAIALGATLSILLAFIINFKWKISAHLSAMGGLVGGILGYSYALAIVPLVPLVFVFLAAALTALSRLELKAHTPAQVYAGFVLGLLSVFLPVIFI